MRFFVVCLVFVCFLILVFSCGFLVVSRFLFLGLSVCLVAWVVWRGDRLAAGLSSWRAVWCLSLSLSLSLSLPRSLSTSLSGLGDGVGLVGRVGWGDVKGCQTRKPPEPQTKKNHKNHKKTTLKNQKKQKPKNPKM